MKRVIVRALRIVLPLVVVGAAIVGAFTMYWNRTPVETQPRVFTPTSVRVQEITLRDVALSVTSQGTVRPRTESQLVPEVAGRITWVAPSFAEGGFFESGDVLVRIDPFDYQQAIVSARSQLAQARLRLAQEEAEADVAVREWDALGRGDPRALTLRKPQLEDARASVAGAEASLERAKRDLERAEIVAPYAGRIRQKNVDIGQFVRVGDAVATIYAVDFAEVRLPLPDEQLAYLDLPLSYRGGADQPQPHVTLRATFAGDAHEWQGRIVRTESEIDPVSRMVHAVAEVADPYAPGSRPPLAVGMYVEAEIEGRTARNVAVVPRAALRGRDRVLVVDADDRLRFREIDILRSTTDAIYVRGGLADGDLVVVSPLDTPTEGMAVQLADADADLLARRRGATPAVTDGMAGRGLDGDIRMARAATSDAPASDASAPEPDADPVSVATTSAAAGDVDPGLSRDERFAAIRRQIELARAAEPTPNRAAAAAAPVVDRSAGAADADTDPGLSGDEQLAAIRRQIELARAAQATLPARATPDASPTRPRAAPTRVADAGPGATAAGPGPVAGPAARLARRADAAPSVAMLPFVNVSRNPADDWIGADITAALRTALEETGTLGVVALTPTDEANALETAGARSARCARRRRVSASRRSASHHRAGARGGRRRSRPLGEGGRHHRRAGHADHRDGRHRSNGGRRRWNDPADHRRPRRHAGRSGCECAGGAAVPRLQPEPRGRADRRSRGGDHRCGDRPPGRAAGGHGGVVRRRRRLGRRRRHPTDRRRRPGHRAAHRASRAERC